MKSVINITAITLIAAINYGCSSSSTPSTPTPNGLYTGSITGGLGDISVGGPNGNEIGIIYNNRFMVFSTAIDIQQMFDATITVTDTSFSGTVSNYNGSTAPKRFTADLSGTFIEKSSTTASFTNFSPANFTDGTLNLISNTALFNKGSNATAVTGSWQGTHGNTGNATSLTVDATGNITTGTDVQGCNFTGSVTSADASINVYNVTITSTGGTGCTSLPAATYTGLAWTEGATDSTLNLTVADGINSRSVILTKN